MTNSQSHTTPRRNFLSKLFLGSAAALAVTSSETVTLAHGPGAKGGEGGKGGRGGARPTPEALAKKLLEEFDKDQDGALNAKELVAALQSMQARRQGRRGGNREGGRGAGGPGKPGEGGKGGRGAGERGQGRRGVGGPGKAKS